MNTCKCIALAAAISLLCSSGTGTEAPPQNAPVVPEKGKDNESAPRKTAGWLGDGSSCYPEATPATEWSPKKNILWSVKIGPSGYSSPCFADGKIFLVAEPSLLSCVDAEKGNILWQKTNEFSDLPEKTEETPAPGETGNTTPTPVSDGQFVYASFGCGIVACYDLQGQRKWIKHVESTIPMDGRGASPVLVGEKLLVSIGSLTALDAKTGKQLWQTEPVKETFGTPAKARIGGVDVAIAPTGEIVRVSDGVVLASTAGSLQCASPIVHDNVVYFMGSSAVALQLPDKAAGNLQVKKLWEASLEGEFEASPVYVNGLLFSASDQGKLFIVDAKDGTVLVNGKDMPIGSQGGNAALPQAHIYNSLTSAGKYVFVNNTAGETLVLEAAREYKEVKKNSLAESSGCTPTFAGRRMYMRGGEELYCVGEK